MTNPFSIHEDDIKHRLLRDTARTQWMENIAPSRDEEVAYLKPSLKINRFRGLLFFSIGALILLLGRSAQLQIIKGGQYRAAAESNRQRIVRLPAPRGAIVDRFSIPLTNNVPKFQIVDEQKKGEIVKTNLNIDELYPFLLDNQENPGLSVETIASREYPKGQAFSHILGYLGKIDQSEKDNYLERGYALNDIVGKTGLEAAFETYLHGKDGRKYFEVDSVGNIKNIIAIDQPEPGNILKTTIDAELQEKAAEFLGAALERNGKKRGSVIVLDPRNGEILALVSLPTVDNNIFNQENRSDEDIQKIMDDPEQPLFFRAIAGLYPSGSVIKPVLAAAALQQGIITPRSTIVSSGGLRIGQWFFPDWKQGGHGPVNVAQAIAYSVNTFFYTIGGGYHDIPGLGIDKITDYLSKFGFGRETGLGIGNEAAGLIPTPEWKKQKREEQWYIGDTYHLAIGQGDFLVTPLQIARMTAYFASGGKWTQPHLIIEHETWNKEQTNSDPEIDARHIETVRQGMRMAVTQGSAYGLGGLAITSAGKTGTAQWSNKNPPHAWFTGWAPYDNAEIVVTVLIEEGGEGSVSAVPVAREIIKWWVENRYLSPKTP